jgi:hypothetical protein
VQPSEQTAAEGELPPLDQQTAEHLFGRCGQAIRVGGSQILEELVAEGFARGHVVWILAQVALSIAISTHHNAGGTYEALEEQIREAWRMQEIVAATTAGRA